MTQYAQPSAEAPIAKDCIRLKVRLFAGLREQIGRAVVEIDLEPGARAIDLRRRLAERFPAVEPLLKRSALAVADEFADDEVVLHPDQVLALIPPVSGGQ